MDLYPGPSEFPPTAWTALDAIVDGGPAAPQALETLLRCYWKPAYVYLRRKGRSEAEAADLVQAFFLHLLEKDLLAQLDRSAGRFRTWLRVVLENFLANRARIEGALKRGGDKRIVSLDLERGEATARAAGDMGPAQAFDRAWAVEVIDRALARLEREHRAAGKPNVLSVLRHRFGLAGTAPPGETVDGTILHRARNRLRALILEEVGDGVRIPGEASDEVKDLFRALGGKG